MARVRLSEDGDLHVPLALREALGLVPGGEVDVTESDGRIIAVPVPAAAENGNGPLTMAEFLDRIPVYEGPPIVLTEAVIQEAVLAEAKRRWEKVDRQLHEDDHG